MEVINQLFKLCCSNSVGILIDIDIGVIPQLHQVPPKCN